MSEKIHPKKAKGIKEANTLLDKAICFQVGLSSKGWPNEPTRHSLASQGVKTSRNNINIEDRKNVREAIRAELEAISMYEKIAEETDNPRLERLFKHIAREEKHHLAEFGVGLHMVDEEQIEVNDEGIQEALEEINDEELTEEDKEKIIDIIHQKLDNFKNDKLTSSGKEKFKTDKIKDMNKFKEMLDEFSHDQMNLGKSNIKWNIKDDNEIKLRIRRESGGHSYTTEWKYNPKTGDYELEDSKKQTKKHAVQKEFKNPERHKKAIENFVYRMNRLIEDAQRR